MTLHYLAHMYGNFIRYIARIWEIQIETSSVVCWDKSCLELTFRMDFVFAASFAYFKIQSHVLYIKTRFGGTALNFVLEKISKRSEQKKICKNWNCIEKYWFGSFFRCSTQHPHIDHVLTASTCLMEFSRGFFSAVPK